MQTRKVILFDLDGTLTESGEGITRSVQYALGKLGIEEPDLSKLRAFIGPPLAEAFRKLYSLSNDEVLRALVYYRERYQPVGLYESELYPGIRELLEKLHQEGHILAVASSKPEPYVRKVLDHFDIACCFDEIVGSTLEEKRTAKIEVIEEVLRRLDRLHDRTDVIMVGDREHDILGAAQASIGCIGVLYGYGSREELEGAGAAAIAATVGELQELLLG